VCVCVCVCTVISTSGFYISTHNLSVSFIFIYFLGPLSHYLIPRLGSCDGCDVSSLSVLFANSGECASACTACFDNLCTSETTYLCLRLLLVWIQNPRSSEHEERVTSIVSLWFIDDNYRITCLENCPYRSTSCPRDYWRLKHKPPQHCHQLWAGTIQSW
jgi:hypothetical protein